MFLIYRKSIISIKRYYKGIILSEEYKCLLFQRIKDLNTATSKEDEKIVEDRKQKVESAIEIFDQIINSNEPSKFLLNSIIEKIVIYNDRTIEFILKRNIDKIVKNDF